MAESNQKLKEILQKLETERDELRVKLGLAKLEARDEWRELEGKMDALRARMKVVGEEAGDASADVRAAASALADEIKKGFEKVRKLL